MRLHFKQSVGMAVLERPVVSPECTHTEKWKSKQGDFFGLYLFIYLICHDSQHVDGGLGTGGRFRVSHCLL